jgi:hypothetical protein
MTFTAEQIHENWEQFLENIDKHISGERGKKLRSFYEDLADQIVLLPASGRIHFHNCMDGGYVDHVNNVVRFSIEFMKLWDRLGCVVNFTEEELVFSAINHDLGKIGIKGKPGYVENPSDWHRKNQGKLYNNNPEVEFMLVPHRSLFLLQEAGIQVNSTEYIGIMTHDGLYEEGNKPYLTANSPETSLRSNLTLILHQADIAAAKFELGRLTPQKEEKTKLKAITAPQAKEAALNRLGSKNPNLLAALKNI